MLPAELSQMEGQTLTTLKLTHQWRIWLSGEYSGVPLPWWICKTWVCIWAWVSGHLWATVAITQDLHWPNPTCRTNGILIILQYVHIHFVSDFLHYTWLCKILCYKFGMWYVYFVGHCGSNFNGKCVFDLGRFHHLSRGFLEVMLLVRKGKTICMSMDTVVSGASQSALSSQGNVCQMDTSLTSQPPFRKIQHQLGQWQ